MGSWLDFSWGVEVGGVGSGELEEMGGKAQNVTAVTFLGHRRFPGFAKRLIYKGLEFRGKGYWCVWWPGTCGSFFESICLNCDVQAWD